MMLIGKQQADGEHKGVLMSDTAEKTRKWFGKFFAVDNSVNEDTVIGCIFALGFLTGAVVPSLGIDYVTLGIAMGAFFGKNIFKK